MKRVAFLLFLLCVTFSTAKVVFLFDETFERAVAPEDAAEWFDFSNMEVIMESDTSMFLNGTWKILKNLTSPWKCRMYAEEFKRGLWIPAIIEKKYPDFCESMHNKNEISYPLFKNLEGCPLPAGVCSSYSVAYLKFREKYIFAVGVEIRYGPTYRPSFPSSSSIPHR